MRGLQFDVVASFGFVEHFEDYEAAIKHHIDMVKPGGFLVLSVPHLWGLQGFLRRIILKKEAVEQIYKTHNLEIMDSEKLKSTLTNLHLEIKYCNYLMGCKFWIPYNSPKIKQNMKFFAFILNRLNAPLLSKFDRATYIVL